MITITTEYIKLQDLLKLAAITATGGEAKLLIQDGEVLVNGEEATLIRTREDFDDMIRHTFVPSRLKS